VNIAHPAMWNRGIALTHTSPGAQPTAAAANRALLVSPRWLSTAPFGRPVVPDVYRTCAGCSGPTEGSDRESSPEPQNCSQSAKRISSRSAGSSDRRPATVAASGLPRHSSTTNMPAALE